ncbi:glycogen debranching N-terminal domain-containing protein [Pseudoroseomonas globiformis]|uniref:Glycogen debranching N-terminal domain-containing protein n=1 Tax=Teichococcus globiformis TaxID=2307229 RepID=A0ABV7G7V7_9PROT
MADVHAMTLKHDESFAVFGPDGDLTGGAQGLYYRDTRHLSFLCLRINGATPQLLSAALQADNSALTCDLTNPALSDAADGAPLPRGELHIRRTRFLWNGSCHERIAIRNFSGRHCRVRLELHFAADFADLFEVRGHRRPAHGEHHRASLTTDSVTLSYTGLDGLRRQTALCFDPAPRQLEAQRAVQEISLPAGGRRTLFMTIGCGEGDAPPPRGGFGAMLHKAKAARREHQARRASVETTDPLLNSVLQRAVSDLGMLTTATPQGPYPYAGTPWYSTAFGRDALITALQTLWLDPSLALGVLRFLAAHQAREMNAQNDAEPGKILHEMRQGEMALLGEVPFHRYYGSVDSTPLFVMLAGAYLDRTGDVDTLRELWPNVEAALDWIRDHGDADGDGFIEYLRKTPNGLINQGWKDSHDAIFHADGEMAEGPIALVELQAYGFAAWQAGSRIAARLGLNVQGQRYAARADALMQAFDAAFWDEDLGSYALALDGRKKPCRVRSSNAGHALYCGIVPPERAAQLARQLLEPDSFCGWGVRTVASGQRRYNPMSYHNGSVWPHDNALIAEGLVRYGHAEAGLRIFKGLLQAASFDPLYRLPELFCGFRRRQGEAPTHYPVACSPQAWAAATPIAMLGACLGLGFDAETRTVTLCRPMLPDTVQHLILRNLTFSGGSLDLRLDRSGADWQLAILDRRGTMDAALLP